MANIVAAIPALAITSSGPPLSFAKKDGGCLVFDAKCYGNDAFCAIVDAICSKYTLKKQ